VFRKQGLFERTTEKGKSVLSEPRGGTREGAQGGPTILGGWEEGGGKEFARLVVWGVEIAKAAWTTNMWVWGCVVIVPRLLVT